MKIEDQVCSLENAKRLKELGVECDSIFHWNNLNCTWLPIIVSSNYQSKSLPAYTVAELGEMLPSGDVTTRKGTVRYHCESMTFDHYELAYTEADTRAAMLIWFIENDYIKAEELNQ